ncbi:MAG: alpha/beta hydrolase [Anaerolineaceae bacterium]|nr:alpha/beta hydrolase [Anaerolineaceae bacterium]
MPLYVDESGTPGAHSVVFLHGIGTSGWMWWRQVEALSDFHCLNVDLPGHGKSNQIAWVSLADTADQIAAIIQAQATEGRAHVVGLSLGGYIGLSLLQHHADTVQSAVLSGVTAAPMPNRNWLRPQLGLMSLLMRNRWYANMQAKALNLPAAMQTEFTDNWLAMSMDTYGRIAKEASEFSVPSGLHQVDVRTLVVAGSKESQIILDAVDAIPRLMPHAKGGIAPDVGHGWNVEAPDLFNAMVRAWVSHTPLPTQLRTIS